MGADPLTMMAISMAGSAVMGALGGRAAQQAGDANAGVANYNAAVIRNQKITAQQKGEFDARRIRERGEKVLAAQRVGYAKGGVQMTGTPLEILGSTAGDIELDAQTALYSSELDSNAMEAQAVMKEYEGKIAQWRGASQAKSAYVGAGISLLGAGYAVL